MTTNGQKGTLFERECRDALERSGYVVIRSAASKTGVDLVALSGERVVVSEDELAYGFRASHVLLVQCKTDGRLDPGEWNRLYAMAMSCDAVPVLARREWAGRRKVVALYVLTGEKVPNSRKPPMRRLALAEVLDAQA